MINWNTQERNNLLIVDGLNLAFSRKDASMLATIQSLARSYKASKIVVLSDLFKSSFRKEIHPGYKAHRGKNLTDEEREERRLMLEKFDEYYTEVLSSTLPCLRLPNVEADDLAAYFVKKLKHKYEQVWLISTDGDWDLLLDENVSRFSTKTRKEYFLDNMFDSHGCDNPKEFALLKALTTDSSDGIEGYPGVGEKRAYSLIKGKSCIFEIYESLPLEGTQKFIDTINTDPERMLKNAALTDLLSVCEIAIEWGGRGNLELVNKFIEEHKL